MGQNVECRNACAQFINSLCLLSTVTIQLFNYMISDKLVLIVFVVVICSSSLSLGLRGLAGRLRFLARLRLPVLQVIYIHETHVVFVGAFVATVVVAWTLLMLRLLLFAQVIRIRLHFGIALVFCVRRLRIRVIVLVILIVLLLLLLASVQCFHGLHSLVRVHAVVAHHVLHLIHLVFNTFETVLFVIAAE